MYYLTPPELDILLAEDVTNTRIKVDIKFIPLNRFNHITFTMGN